MRPRGVGGLTAAVFVLALLVDSSLAAPCPAGRANLYETNISYASNAAGGYCTCPDGQRYWVGAIVQDHLEPNGRPVDADGNPDDGCSNGLACFRGASESCGPSSRDYGAHMVTCCADALPEAAQGVIDVLQTEVDPARLFGPNMNIRNFVAYVELIVNFFIVYSGLLNLIKVQFCLPLFDPSWNPKQLEKVNGKQNTPPGMVRHPMFIKSIAAPNVEFASSDYTAYVVINVERDDKGNNRTVMVPYNMYTQDTPGMITSLMNTKPEGLDFADDVKWPEPPYFMYAINCKMVDDILPINGSDTDARVGFRGRAQINDVIHESQFSKGYSTWVPAGITERPVAFSFIRAQPGWSWCPDLVDQRVNEAMVAKNDSDVLLDVLTMESVEQMVLVEDGTCEYGEGWWNAGSGHGVNAWEQDRSKYRISHANTEPTAVYTTERRHMLKTKVYPNTLWKFLLVFLYMCLAWLSTLCPVYSKFGVDFDQTNGISSHINNMFCSNKMDSFLSSILTLLGPFKTLTHITVMTTVVPLLEFFGTIMFIGTLVAYWSAVFGKHGRGQVQFMLGQFQVVLYVWIVNLLGFQLMNAAESMSYTNTHYLAHIVSGAVFAEFYLATLFLFDQIIRYTRNHGLHNIPPMMSEESSGMLLGFLGVNSAIVALLDHYAKDTAPTCRLDDVHTLLSKFTEAERISFDCDALPKFETLEEMARYKDNTANDNPVDRLYHNISGLNSGSLKPSQYEYLQNHSYVGTFLDFRLDWITQTGIRTAGSTLVEAGTACVAQCYMRDDASSTVKMTEKVILCSEDTPNTGGTWSFVKYGGRSVANLCQLDGRGTTVDVAEKSPAYATQAANMNKRLQVLEEQNKQLLAASKSFQELALQLQAQLNAKN